MAAPDVSDSISSSAPPEPPAALAGGGKGGVAVEEAEVFPPPTAVVVTHPGAAAGGPPIPGHLAMPPEMGLPIFCSSAEIDLLEAPTFVDGPAALRTQWAAKNTDFGFDGSWNVPDAGSGEIGAPSRATAKWAVLSWLQEILKVARGPVDAVVRMDDPLYITLIKFMGSLFCLTGAWPSLDQFSFIGGKHHLFAVAFSMFPLGILYLFVKGDKWQWIFMKAPHLIKWIYGKGGPSFH